MGDTEVHRPVEPSVKTVSSFELSSVKSKIDIMFYNKVGVSRIPYFDHSF